MRARRLALSVDEVHAKSEAICHRLVSRPVFTAARSVMVYVSRGNEVMTHELIQQMLAEGRQVGVPLFDATQETYYASLIENFPGDLTPGLLQILEPRPEKIRPVGVDQFAALLVPGLAFDESGGRLGRGKGYYDRMLEDARGVKIALAYDFQIVDEVPMHAHDVHMDFVITETRIITCKRKST